VTGWADKKTVKVWDSVIDAVIDADLVVTATFAATPILLSTQVKLGAHIMAVGACTPDMAELDPELLQNSQVQPLDLFKKCPVGERPMS
jgi:ornithine cyclodeaminase/alanine dehydrogenase-like protein (mu-crystallin family)